MTQLQAATLQQALATAIRATVHQELIVCNVIHATPDDKVMVELNLRDSERLLRCNLENLL